MSVGKRGEAGQAAIVLLAVLVAILAIAGLAIDGGAVVTAKIGLQADADAAARSGAGAIDQGAFLAGRGALLNSSAAEGATRSYLGSVCPDCTASVAATTQEVTVALHRRQPTFFLQVVGVGSVDVAASATARPVAP